MCPNRFMHLYISYLFLKPPIQYQDDVSRFFVMVSHRYCVNGTARILRLNDMLGYLYRSNVSICKRHHYKKICGQKIMNQNYANSLNN